MKTKTKNKKERGITLIALVVTIVVILILAGTTIAMLTGDNGIITMAQKAKEEYEQASKDEQQKLAEQFEKDYSTYNGKLQVEGRNLVNQHNEIVQLKGVNLGGRDYLYLYQYNILKKLKEKGINCIRLGLGPEYYTDETYIQYMKNIVDNCISLDLYIDLVFWNNGNPNEKILLAQEYFNYWGSKQANSINIIYEICNEVDQNVIWSDIKEYANKVIPQIRDINPNAIIIVGTPFYDSSATEVIGNEINFTNIMYAIHRYPALAESTNLVSLKNFNTAYYNNIPIIVTEWSLGNSLGENLNLEEANKLAKLMKEYKTSWIYYTLDPSGKYSFDILKEYSDDLEEKYLTDSGKYFLSILNDNEKENWTDYDYMLAERTALNFEGIKEEVKEVEFINKIEISNNATEIRDASKYGTGKVISYIIDDNSIGGKKLVIAANNKYIYAPQNSRNIFGSFKNLSNIDFGNFNTKYAENIEVMFYNTALENIDLSNLDLSNVTDISEMVNTCSKLESLNISNIDFENIKDTNNLFYKTKDGITIYVKDTKAAQIISNELIKSSVTGNIYYRTEDKWEKYE